MKPPILWFVRFALCREGDPCTLSMHSHPRFRDMSGEYRPRRTGRLFVTLTQTTSGQSTLRGVVCVKYALRWAWSILARRHVATDDFY